MSEVLEVLPAALLARVAACHACTSMAYAHVLGETNGRAGARVMFVGEAPGRLGAGRSGVPFSGDEAGRRFESLLAGAGLHRDEVFVTNAVLCNPLDASQRNRRPLVTEMTRCLPFLRQQVEAVRPEIVVALGGVALEALRRIEPHELRLSRDAGRVAEWYGRRLVPLYHPGRRALVHRSEELQRDDWLALRALLSSPRAP